MSASLVGLWILVGICPPWPPWPPWPWPPKGPSPYPWLLRIAGIAGGVIGGWGYTQLFPAGGELTGIAAAATAVGAYAGAVAGMTIAAGIAAPRASG